MPVSPGPTEVIGFICLSVSVCPSFLPFLSMTPFVCDYSYVRSCMAFICISVMANDVQCLFMSLLGITVFLEKYFLIFFCHLFYLFIDTGG